METGLWNHAITARGGGGVIEGCSVVVDNHVIDQRVTMEQGSCRHSIMFGFRYKYITVGKMSPPNHDCGGNNKCSGVEVQYSVYPYLSGHGLKSLSQHFF